MQNIRLPKGMLAFFAQLEDLLLPKNKRWRKLLAVIGHLALVALALLLAFALRFEFHLSPKEINTYVQVIGLLFACRLISLAYWQQFDGLWRYVTVQDMVSLLKANLAGSGLFVLGLLFWKGQSLEGLPRSVLAMEFILSTGMMASLRLLARSYREAVVAGQHSKPDQVNNTLIVGAGSRGVSVAREALNNPLLGMRLVGFLDDDPVKRGRRVLSYPVLGGTNDVGRVVKSMHVDQVIVAMPDAPTKVLLNVQEACAQCQVNYRVLRSTKELASNQPLRIRLRETKVEDIMERDLICFDDNCRVSKLASKEGQTILVTGAAGSIGSELCRQLAVLSPLRLILLDQSESGLYDIQQELKRKLPTLNMSVIVGDICDERKVKEVFRRFKPDLVYHAAAYKHVPLMENEPIEAVRTNVLGSYYLGQAAQSVGTRRFVFISTDKAVNPVSVMGMTKLAAERILSSFNVGGCRFMSVRFGNVLNSNGSVIPLFRRQVADGGPVTVTHPDVTRFFMATEEAVNLVMAAGDLGRGGEVFLLDMGEPVRIMDVARKVILLAGLEPEQDIEIKVTGLRPGEKLHEELFWLAEGVKDTSHTKIKAMTKQAMTANDVEHWAMDFTQATMEGDDYLTRSLLTDFVAISADEIQDSKKILEAEALANQGKILSLNRTVVRGQIVPMTGPLIPQGPTGGTA